ncbi:unnamed protein product [Aphanomyces euteiches]|uniref:Uncharacterized protein n=1 Tax=Aphanomyces euteiches TaxID=100861 RepID=A0A6G0W9L3_9STRA|nr:hypothetical protein Ae201684_017382 [Aphanomyces euteiches]KAH9106077.1 hypothetical protein AeMF1_018259 [Aphanomyces euteiches]KAH9123341.1 hypothetical protein LEN26_009969 [Aphanomyces euteiches]KAH9132288.1 hypothetical protein AeRB84_021274 [Aphanomyces euteiches]KAH9193181.1 hypothetical protein AeNC1_004856 [Aphanomyces euteiches]
MGVRCRECLEEFCSGAALFLCNGIDLACGIALVAYGSFLGLNHFAPEWLFGPLLGLGGLLVVTALMSWCGSACPTCSVMLLISSWLLVFVALFELVLSIVIFTQGPAIEEFLKEHQEQLHLTDDQLRLLEKNKFIPAYLLIGLFVMEVFRYCCSSYLRRARQQNKYAYMNLKNLKDMEAELVRDNRKQELSSKYENLRGHYKAKYSRNP